MTRQSSLFDFERDEIRRIQNGIERVQERACAAIDSRVMA
ncbi:MAG: hypothetical protein J07HX64_00915 [halophilic archaeon J07HX64]|nr:MAG: hypothetical protein J07HX64_00915 [halophilic archaeon J07HX64]